MKTNFLTQGDIFVIERGDKIYINNFPQHFIFANRQFDFSPSSSVCEVLIGGIKNDFNTECLMGEYVVIKTLSDGGSKGGRDDYPNGHHVYAKKIVQNLLSEELSEMTIHFYQSGCFGAMLPDKKATGRIKVSTIIERE